MPGEGLGLLMFDCDWPNGLAVGLLEPKLKLLVGTLSVWIGAGVVTAGTAGVRLAGVAPGSPPVGFCVLNN